MFKYLLFQNRHSISGTWRDRSTHTKTGILLLILDLKNRTRTYLNSWTPKLRVTELLDKNFIFTVSSIPYNHEAKDRIESRIIQIRSLHLTVSR